MLQVSITNSELYSTMVLEEPNLDNLSYNAYNKSITGNVGFYITEAAQDAYEYDFTHYVSSGEHSGSDFEEQFGFSIVWLEA